MIRLPCENLYPRYADMQLEPLRVTARLHGPVVWYDPPALDGLLAAAVVRETFRGRGLADAPQAYDIPLPLQCLWRNRQGWPLWAASYFRPPPGEFVPDVVYQHKRAISGTFSRGRGGRLSINTSSGRHKERRVPYPVVHARRLEAVCLGNRAEVKRLLQRYIAFVGKRRATGLGQVAAWEVEGLDADTDVLIYQRKNTVALGRALPEGAVHLLGDWQPTEPTFLVGWTPPQWKKSLYTPGWPCGCRLQRNAEPDEIDWYASVP